MNHYTNIIITQINNLLIFYQYKNLPKLSFCLKPLNYFMLFYNYLLYIFKLGND